MLFKTQYTDVSSPSITQHLEVTDVCFVPKAIYSMWTEVYPGTPGETYLADDNVTFNGWTVGPGDEQRNRVRFNKASANSNEITADRFSNNGSLDSFDDCGFTVFEHTGFQWDSYYMAFGGPTLEVANGEFQLPSSGTSDVVVTGVGFQPDFIIVIGQGKPGDIWADYCVGMASSPDSADQAACCQHAGFGTNVGNRFQAGFLCTDMISHLAHLESFDADGFTVGVDSAASNTINYSFLAFRDPNTAFKVGVAQQPTSTGTQAITGVGFLPGGGLFAGTKMTSPNADTAGNVAAQMFMGATDGRLSFGSSVAFKSAATSGTQQKTYDGPVISSIDPEAGSAPNTTLAEADLDSWDSDGFTLDWTIADSEARYFMYGVWEAQPGDPCPCGGVISFDLMFPQ